MFWILACVALVLVFYYFLLKPQLYWKERNVTQGTPVPVFGDNFKVMMKTISMAEMVTNVYRRFDNVRYTGMYQMSVPTLMIRDLDLIKQITVKDFDHFLDHRAFQPNKADEIWSRNLFALKGEEWREMRATLSPTFTSSKMRSMFTLMEKSAKQYVNFYLDQQKKVIDIELKESLSRFANDVIANCAFGITVDSLKEPTNDFYVNGKDITDFTGFTRMLKFFIATASPKLFELLNLSLFPAYTADFFKSLVRDTIKVREDKNIIRPDMINLLMEARKGKLKYEESEEQDAGFATVDESDVGKKVQARKFEMTENDMAAQVLIFFFAGFDTISTMMSFMGYELACNPDIQDKLRQEIDETYADCKGNLTYDVINKMKYLDMVVSESMRMHPPVIALDRECTKPYTIEPANANEKPLHLKPGDDVWLPVYGIHYDEQHYPNPQKFDPERFSDENKGNINPYAYLPFGVGPRNCIGSRFALMEVKTLTFHLLTKFEFVVIEKTPIPMKLSKFQFNPYIEGGFWVGFKTRENPINL